MSNEPDEDYFEQAGYAVRFGPNRIEFANYETWMPLVLTFVGVIGALGFTLVALLLVFDAEQNATAALGCGVLAIIGTAIAAFAWSRYKEQTKHSFEDSVKYRLQEGKLENSRGDELGRSADLDVSVKADASRNLGHRIHNVEITTSKTTLVVFKTNDKQIANTIAERVRAILAAQVILEQN